MIQAYNDTTLYNKYVRQQALEAFHREGISAETHEKIIRSHPLYLYTSCAWPAYYRCHFVFRIAFMADIRRFRRKCIHCIIYSLRGYLVYSA